MLVPRLLSSVGLSSGETVCCLPVPPKAPGGRRHSIGQKRPAEGKEREGRGQHPLPRPESTGMPTLAQSREEKEGTVLAGRGGRFSPWAPQGEAMPGKGTKALGKGK